MKEMSLEEFVLKIRDEKSSRGWYPPTRNMCARGKVLEDGDIRCTYYSCLCGINPQTKCPLFVRRTKNED